MDVILAIIGGILLILLLWYLYRTYIKKEKSIRHLPLQRLGFHHVPAYPIILTEVLETLLNLAAREREISQAKSGLSEMFTIQGYFANAYSFVFGKTNNDEREKELLKFRGEVKKNNFRQFKNSAFVKRKLTFESNSSIASKQSLTNLSLDKPSQFSLSWTTFGNIFRNASEKLLPIWTKTISNAEEATKQFFPTIAKYGAAYNLLILQKVTDKNLSEYRNAFPKQWTEEMDLLYKKGNLYVIDFRIYATLEPQEAKGSERFTPTTFTWLKQNSKTKELRPFAIYVSGYNGNHQQFYDINTTTESAWLYALQAVKTSVTVYGIWLGHVYHWHLVTASMIMTMFNNISKTHPIYEILAPQSKYIIGFNDVLVLLWEKIAPPTSIKTPYQFLELIDNFAKDRTFFDDDPTNTLKKLGLSKRDFTVSEPWDMYPIIGYLLKIWEIVKEYTYIFVENTYISNEAVKKDTELQAWIAAAGQKENGNIKGLPKVDTKQKLQQILTSILYRITAHGLSRMDNTANPALTFVGNYPPTLQSAHIPEPSSTFSTEELLQYLPNTGTIGEMITFYYTFVNSAPYEPLIPVTGADEDLFFSGGGTDARNIALADFRNKLTSFIKQYTIENKIPDLPPNMPQIHQWPMNIET
ncbi:lipoxygenase family protein [Aquimarina sp. 2201CG5-10]|uniref:lipoxygenase family protein n=1 Tax=Aquimarina callyspongiae TaxID=3098150 RepID=UPI002AB53D53|nr:lipoxygenase family protein [Aquimarina sp. 2201CG5-10]MDY8138567.1 lipoxygenase family protein [Aquimarina sp. 2201CG5-10]